MGAFLTSAANACVTVHRVLPDDATVRGAGLARKTFEAAVASGLPPVNQRNSVLSTTPGAGRRRGTSR